MDETTEFYAPLKDCSHIEMTEGQRGAKRDVLSCANSGDSDRPSHQTPFDVYLT